MPGTRQSRLAAQPCKAPLAAADVACPTNLLVRPPRLFMRDKFKAHFKDGDIKYIDPSYIIR